MAGTCTAAPAPSSTMSYSMIFVATRLLWLLLTPQFYAKFNHFQQFQPSISAGAGNVLGYSGGHCHWLARNMEIECAQLTSASVLPPQLGHNLQQYP